MEYLKFLLMLLIAKLAYGDGTFLTTSGAVRGKNVSSGKVEAFLGIPYAEPPVGPLRFARPVPKAPWGEVYDATELPPSCIQANFGELFYTPNTNYMSEDCLYLNLWVPRQQKGCKPKPIILFIHGGIYMFGSSNMDIYDGATLAEYGDVIVVTINYRLGALGFFYGLIDEAAGSMGMYDQLAAMRWIKDNARVFQGDPENIILMGESAGAFSASAHQISPLSRNLFNRAILISGSTLNPMYSDNNQKLLKLSQVYANLLGCATETETLERNPRRIVDCMKQVPPEKFSEVDMTLFAKNLGTFIPRIGDPFLPRSTIEAYRQGHFKDTEVLLGVIRDEGTLLLTALKPDYFGFFGEKDVSSSFNETVLIQLLKAFFKTDDERRVQSIFNAYKHHESYGEGTTLQKMLSDIIGDFLITCGALFQADFQALRSNPIYFYRFEYRPPSTPLAEWMGVTHFEDLPYIFGNPMHGNFTEDEIRFSRGIMDKWIAFAKTGNPNFSENRSSKQRWPKYTSKDPKYLILDKQTSVGMRPDNYRCEIWRSQFGSVIDNEVIRNLFGMTQQQLVLHF